MISSEHIKIYTSITGHSKTNVPSNASGKAKHHDANITLMAS